MKALHKAVRCMSAVASGLVLSGATAAADISGTHYRDALREANATYSSDLLNCTPLSGEERISCRREAGAVRNEARAAAKALRAESSNAGNQAGTSRRPGNKSGTDAGTIQKKGGMDPKLQRDSPPDIHESMKK